MAFKISNGRRGKVAQQHSDGSSEYLGRSKGTVIGLVKLTILCLVARGLYNAHETVSARIMSISNGGPDTNTTSVTAASSSHGTVKTKTTPTPVPATKHITTNPINGGFTTATTDTKTTITSTTNKRWDSSKSVVIGLAVNYALSNFQTFVESLRTTGYVGHIILGISEDSPAEVLEYLAKHRVTTHTVKVTKGFGGCTYYNMSTMDGVPWVNQACTEAYPDYKISWGRFPLARDWLLQCQECTDGVMLTDVRDTFFQSDPFAYVEENPAPLMLFEEIYPNQTAEHWLTDGPVSSCRKFRFTAQHPMLCSGSTMGSREGILEYIRIMVEEMDYWKQRVECRSEWMVGDDQSIHNFLYYTNRFPNDTVTYAYRTGPINVIGVEANLIFRSAIKKLHEDGGGDGGRFKDKYEAEGYVNTHRYYGSDEANWRQWLGPEHRLIDPETGHLLNLDGRPSPQVHQYDRFSSGFVRDWLEPMVKEWNQQLDEKLQQLQQHEITGGMK